MANTPSDIIHAETGEDALEIVSNQRIDIILLDNQLPGINGIDVLEYIKKKGGENLLSDTF